MTQVYRLPRIVFQDVDDYLEELAALKRAEHLVEAVVRVQARFDRDGLRGSASLLSSVLTPQSVVALEVPCGNFFGQQDVQVRKRVQELEAKILGACEELGLRVRPGEVAA